MLIGFAAALGHAAVNEKAAAMGLDQKARPRDRLRRTVKSDVHEASVDDPYVLRPNLKYLAKRFLGALLPKFLS